MKAVLTLTWSIIVFLPGLNLAQETPTFEIIQTEIFNMRPDCLAKDVPGWWHVTQFVLKNSGRHS